MTNIYIVKRGQDANIIRKGLFTTNKIWQSGYAGRKKNT